MDKGYARLTIGVQIARFELERWEFEGPQSSGFLWGFQEDDLSGGC